MFVNAIKPNNTPIPGCTVNWDQYISEKELDPIKELRRKLRGCPDWDDATYDAVEHLMGDGACMLMNTNTESGSSPRMFELQTRRSGGIMDVSASDFIPSNRLPAGVPVAQSLANVKPGPREMMLMRRWKKLHAPLLTRIAERVDRAVLEDDAARREANAAFVAAEVVEEARRTSARPVPPPPVDDAPPPAISAAQQARVDAEHARVTALNEAESAMRRAMRAAIDAEKASKKPERAYSTPGPSGPSKPTAWAEDVPGESMRSKRKGKKAISCERAEEHRQALEAKERLRIAQREEQREASRKAFAIGGSRA